MEIPVVAAKAKNQFFSMFNHNFINYFEYSYITICEFGESLNIKLFYSKKIENGKYYLRVMAQRESLV